MKKALLHDALSVFLAAGIYLSCWVMPLSTLIVHPGGGLSLGSGSADAVAGMSESKPEPQSEAAGSDRVALEPGACRAQFDLSDDRLVLSIHKDEIRPGNPLDIRIEHTSGGLRVLMTP